VGRKEIEEMIAESLEAEDRPRRRPVAHAQHILDQYVRLCDGESDAASEPSAEVSLPVGPADRAPPPRAARPLAAPKKAIGRVKRR
jgi:hypothetical protein